MIIILVIEVLESLRSGKKKIKRSKGDHLWDCEILARALSKFIGIARIDRDVEVVDAQEQRPRKKLTNRSRGGASFWA